MRLEDVTAEIRPRSQWEAIDLGLAMVRRDAGRLLVCWLVTALPVHLLVLVLLHDWLWLAVGVLWWLRPIFSRVSLFFLSRALFGERPTVRQVLRAWPAMWWRRFAYRMLWARFSPWRAMSVPVEELEHLRGPAFRRRCTQLLSRAEGSAIGLLAVSGVLTLIGILSLVVLGLMFVPQEVMTQWSADYDLWLESDEMGLSAGLQWLLAGVTLVTFAAVDVLYTGAGFGLYVNSRTLVEGWDIELAFKRMRDRLGGVLRPAALLVFAALLFAGGEPAHADAGNVQELAEQAVEHTDPGDDRSEGRSEGSIKDVLANPDFKIHTVEELVPVAKPPSSGAFNFAGLGVFAAAVSMLGWLVLALLLGAAIWLVWRYWPRPGGASAARAAPLQREVRTVMGMDIGPESLPADIPAAAWRAWQLGSHQDAMSLLYRGAIGALVRHVHVEIEESDTERDCLRRVSQLGNTRESRYFEGLTGSWISLAYGRSVPDDGQMQTLCREWPFNMQGGRG